MSTLKDYPTVDEKTRSYLLNYPKHTHGPPTTAKILAGKNNPGFEYLQSILLTFPELNARWLLTGQGRMFE